MAKGNVDLDRSLDDIIKRGKSRPTRGKGNNSNTQSSRGNRGRQAVTNTRVSRPTNSNRDNSSTPVAINRRLGGATNERNSPNRINSRLNRGAINKPQHGRNDVRRGGNNNNHNSRPAAVNGKGQSKRNSSTTRVRGPDMSTQRNNTESVRRNSIDPKSLVITKAIPKRKAVKEAPAVESLVIQSNISHQQQQHTQLNSYGYHDNVLPPPPPPSRTSYSNPPAHQAPPVQCNSANQKNIVLVCNLDPRATAEDVGEACSTFGPILSCDVLLDPMGRPLNEAEIEFLYPSSAEECVSKLDNTVADGRLLRARLQSSATLPVVPRYSSRTVVASARLAQGGFDNPRSQAIMYDDQYQSTNYRGNNNNSSYQHSQQQRRY